MKIIVYTKYCPPDVLHAVSIESDPFGLFHKVTTVEDKASTILIELLRENRKRKIPLRHFSPQNRVRIVNCLIERVKNRVNV